MDVILYSTGCPKCKVLEKKLTDKNVPYYKENSIDVMESLGICQVPMLLADGKLMTFSEANKWVNEK